MSNGSQSSVNWKLNALVMRCLILRFFSTDYTLYFVQKFMLEAREELTKMKVLQDEDNALTPRGHAVDDVLERLEDGEKQVRPCSG
jgi:hypothetical protein